MVADFVTRWYWQSRNRLVANRIFVRFIRRDKIVNNMQMDGIYFDWDVRNVGAAERREMARQGIEKAKKRVCLYVETASRPCRTAVAKASGVKRNWRWLKPSGFIISGPLLLIQRVAWLCTKSVSLSRACHPVPPPFTWNRDQRCSLLNSLNHRHSTRHVARPFYKLFR